MYPSMDAACVGDGRTCAWLTPLSALLPNTDTPPASCEPPRAPRRGGNSPGSVRRRQSIRSTTARPAAIPPHRPDPSGVNDWDVSDNRRVLVL